MLTIGERPKESLLLVFMGMDLILKPNVLVLYKPSLKNPDHFSK